MDVLTAAGERCHGAWDTTALLAKVVSSPFCFLWTVNVISFPCRKGRIMHGGRWTGQPYITNCRRKWQIQIPAWDLSCSFIIHLWPARGNRQQKGHGSSFSLLTFAKDKRRFLGIGGTLYSWGTKFSKLKIMKEREAPERGKEYYEAVFRFGVDDADEQSEEREFKELGWEGRGLCLISGWDAWTGACLSRQSVLSCLSPSHASPGCKWRESSACLGQSWAVVQLGFKTFDIKRSKHHENNQLHNFLPPISMESSYWWGLDLHQFSWEKNVLWVARSRTYTCCS